MDKRRRFKIKLIEKLNKKINRFDKTIATKLTKFIGEGTILLLNIHF